MLNQLVCESIGNGLREYTYDKNGNQIKVTSNIAGDKQAEYVYDKEGHLTVATQQVGNEVTITRYGYDYAGNRIWSQTNEQDKLYFVTDTTGLSMVLAETDEEGAVTDTYSYDAWGNQLTKTGGTSNDYLYAGECFDANTGLYYLRARYMNPVAGLFISMDSYQGSIYEPVSQHKYLYANANPVKYVMKFAVEIGVTCSGVQGLTHWVLMPISCIYFPTAHSAILVSDFYRIRKFSIFLVIIREI